MKITLIHGQNHKGSSYHIGRMLAEKLTTEDNMTEFFLPRDLNHFCLGCYQCVEDKTKCPFYAEKHIIEQAMEKSDLLIFTTPTYNLRASAPMMSFLQLNFTKWMPHTPEEYMFHKKAVVISTAAGGGTRTAMKDVKTSLFYMGIPYIKTFGIAVQAMNWESVADKKKDKIEKSINKLAQKIERVDKPVVGIKTRFIFNMMRKMHGAGWDASPVEQNYWKEKGWLGGDRPWK